MTKKSNVHPHVAGKVHPEAPNVVDMRWVALSEVTKMLRAPRPLPPRRAAKAAAVRQARRSSSRVGGGGPPAGTAGPSEGAAGPIVEVAGPSVGAVLPNGSKAVSRPIHPSRGKPSEDPSGLHFVAWHVLRSNHVLSWLVKESHKAAVKAGGPAKSIQAKLEIYARGLFKRWSQTGPEQPEGSQEPPAIPPGRRYWGHSTKPQRKTNSETRSPSEKATRPNPQGTESRMLT